MSDIAEAIKTETREKLKTAEPDKYDVLFLNDEITTVDFVIRIL